MLIVKSIAKKNKKLNQTGNLKQEASKKNKIYLMKKRQMKKSLWREGLLMKVITKLKNKKRRQSR